MGAFDGELNRLGYKSQPHSEECKEPYYTPPDRVEATIKCVERGAKNFENLGLFALAQQHREVFYRRFSIPLPTLPKAEA